MQHTICVVRVFILCLHCTLWPPEILFFCFAKRNFSLNSFPIKAIVYKQLQRHTYCVQAEQMDSHAYTDSSITPPLSPCIKHRQKSNFILSNIEQMLFSNKPIFVTLVTARKLSRLHLHHLIYLTSGSPLLSPVEFMLCLY